MKEIKISQKKNAAIVWLQRNQEYICQDEILKITNDREATQIREKIDFINTGIQRWFEKINYFNFRVEYALRSMHEADVESRKFNSNIEKTLEELLYVIQRSIRIILNEGFSVDLIVTAYWH